MKVCILAGGMGTRLSEETETKPKPMVEVGENPIIWHIMKYYASFGHRDFHVALGYKGHIIKNFFLNYYHHNNSFQIDLESGKIKSKKTHQENWLVNCVDTGLETGTGGRLKKLKSEIGKNTFLMTYGDGLSNVDINKVIQFHKKSKKLVTVTAVRPLARFGGLTIENNRVKNFVEKPQTGEGWINGGFFVLEPGVFDYIKNDDEMFEKSPLERLVADDQLSAYQHEGFWQCMDTKRDSTYLNSLWNEGKAAWKNW